MSLAVILIAGSAIIVWFRGLVLYFWDTTFPFNPPAAMTSYFWPWSDLISTGVPLVGNYALPYFGVVYFFHNLLGFSFLVTQVCLYYLLFEMGGISMYFLFLRQVVPRFGHSAEARLGALAASLVYMFNPYWMVYLWQSFSLEAFLYATLPVILFLFQRGLSNASSFRNNLRTIFALAAVTLLAAPAIGIPAFSIPLIIGLALFYLCWLGTRNNAKNRLASTRFVFLAVLSLVVVHLWWIYPESLSYGSQLVRAASAGGLQ